MSEGKTKMKKKGTIGKVILSILLGLMLVMMLVFGALMYVIPAFETVNGQVKDGAASWMAELPDDRSLNEVVIPGTHDSGTKYADLAFFSKCQGLGIREQLEAGYRYLDIRLAVDGYRMKLMHGFTNCKSGGWPFSGTLYLDDVLYDCYEFLKEHPTETILFSVKQEHGNESAAVFQERLHDYIDRNAASWLLTDRVPTVGEARGKLVLFRRYEDRAKMESAFGISLYWAKQSNKTETELDVAEEKNGLETVWVQDRYKYDTDDKWAAFCRGLEKARTSPDDTAVHFLSTNGPPTFGHPFKYAKALNEKLGTLDGKLSGWVIVDFGSSEMAEFIYRHNFR